LRILKEVVRLVWLVRYERRIMVWILEGGEREKRRSGQGLGDLGG